VAWRRSNILLAIVNRAYHIEITKPDGRSPIGLGFPTNEAVKHSVNMKK
jgi:hypothetical protein